MKLLDGHRKLCSRSLELFKSERIRAHRFCMLAADFDCGPADFGHLSEHLCGGHGNIKSSTNRRYQWHGVLL